MLFDIMHQGVKVIALNKTEDYEITVEAIEPNGEIFSHYHPDFETELILSENLLLNNEPVKLGTVKTWKPHMAHGYKNISNTEGAVLSIYFGKWSNEKEILIKKK